MKQGLSQQLVSGSKAREKPYEIRDGGNRGVKGLLLRIQPSGSKTYYVEFARGKRLRLGSADMTLTRARALATKAKAQVIDGEDPRKSGRPITLSEFLETIYRPHYKLHHRSDAALANLNAFRPLFELRLTSLTQERITRWRSDRIRDGRKPTTINRNISALKALLSHAVEEGYLPANPLTGYGALAVEQANRVRYLSDDEEARLRAALDEREADIRSQRENGNRWREVRGYELMEDLSNLPFADHLKPMVLLSLNTGLRRGELFALEWRDYFDGSITVQRSKSYRARHIPLNTEALSVLEGWRAVGSERWIFENDGKPFGHVKRAWHGVLERAQITDFRWHDLRHTFASLLVMGGRARDASGDSQEEIEKDRSLKRTQRAVPLNTVRELMGHSDIKMTLRYAHLAPGHMREAVEALSL